MASGIKLNRRLFSLESRPHNQIDSGKGTYRSKGITKSSFSVELDALKPPSIETLSPFVTVNTPICSKEDVPTDVRGAPQWFQVLCAAKRHEDISTSARAASDDIWFSSLRTAGQFRIAILWTSRFLSIVMMIFFTSIVPYLLPALSQLNSLILGGTSAIVFARVFNIACMELLLGIPGLKSWLRTRITTVCRLHQNMVPHCPVPEVEISRYVMGSLTTLSVFNLRVPRPNVCAMIVWKFRLGGEEHHVIDLFKQAVHHQSDCSAETKIQIPSACFFLGHNGNLCVKPASAKRNLLKLVLGLSDTQWRASMLRAEVAPWHDFRISDIRSWDLLHSSGCWLQYNVTEGSAKSREKILFLWPCAQPVLSTLSAQKIGDADSPDSTLEKRWTAPIPAARKQSLLNRIISSGVLPLDMAMLKLTVSIDQFRRSGKFGTYVNHNKSVTFWLSFGADVVLCASIALNAVCVWLAFGHGWGGTVASLSILPALHASRIAMMNSSGFEDHLDCIVSAFVQVPLLAVLFNVAGALSPERHSNFSLMPLACVACTVVLIVTALSTWLHLRTFNATLRIFAGQLETDKRLSSVGCDNQNH